MKKWITVIAVCIAAAALFAGVLSFCDYHFIFWGDKAVSICCDGIANSLSPEDAKLVVSILNGKEYTPGAGGCPFGEELSVSVDGVVFALSQDGCTGLMELQHRRYYTVSQADWALLNSVFQKYGGALP